MSRTRKRRMMNQINVVPYIDVTLVLLVIFMVTAPMTNPGVIDLPKVGQGALEQKPVPPIVVTVKLSNKIELENVSITRDILLMKVSQALKENPQRSVVIAADKNVKYDDVTAIMGLLKPIKDIKLGLLLAPTN
ncbi:MAG: biopolymer transporter ExbD [Methylotenera sp.]|uniref:biopolymer transporter ExbD n=1 Tax=Methylotenera sp. TaxID=2051956 RepID=UPI002728F359|nr:biopolymer transporter ExbD [Methylotenera sp.]MDO9205781.1 biopolymer transporter ExbD [Methylotenera sp.]MDO9394298.1 biopolymer transporter ExbD [Methylotenera sp.]MDP1524124.1 biopolymer transporter ExbD [Methylotenera sp.]